jgi:hypothetical protein
MSSSHTRGLVPDKQWLGIIDRLLEGTPAEQAEARKTLWVEVERYVVSFAQLPIGPLSDDADVRHDIALRVLRKLEKRDCRHLRLWLERQRHRQDSSVWWGWISTMTRHMAIDVARASRQNLSARHEEVFRWARIVPTEPAILDQARRETLRRAFDFLERASEGDVANYLAALQGIQSGGPQQPNGDGTGEVHQELRRTPAKRGENGENGDGGGTT